MRAVVCLLDRLIGCVRYILLPSLPFSGLPIAHASGRQQGAQGKSDRPAARHLVSMFEFVVRVFVCMCTVVCDSMPRKPRNAHEKRKCGKKMK